MDNMRNAKITCIAYCMKASMSPIRSSFWSILWAPTQTTVIDVKFSSRIITGCITPMIRLTVMLTFIKSALVCSNRACSHASRSKARMTRMPVSRSRVTRLRRSTSCCKRVKRGMASNSNATMTTKSTPTATAMIQVIDGARSYALMTAPMPIKGAINASRSSI